MTTAIATPPTSTTTPSTEDNTRQQYYDRIRAAWNRSESARKAWQDASNIMLSSKWEAGVVVREHYNWVESRGESITKAWQDMAKALGMSTGWLRQAKDLADAFTSSAELLPFVTEKEARDFCGMPVDRRKRQTVAERKAQIEADKKAAYEAGRKAEADRKELVPAPTDATPPTIADSFTGPDVVDDQVVDEVLAGLSEVVRILAKIEAITTDDQGRALFEVTAQVHRLTNPGDQS